MKKSLSILAVLMLVACSNEFVDKRVEAYSRAESKISEATASDELVRISYDLHYELAALDAELGSLDSVARLASSGDESYKELIEAIDGARRSFEDKLLQQEIGFYVSMGNKK